MFAYAHKVRDNNLHEEKSVGFYLSSARSTQDQLGGAPDPLGYEKIQAP
jgi:hypothetical protein